MENSKLPGALCDKCPLQKEPCVPPCGPKDASLILVGEAPGYWEVEQGKPFVGQSGKLLAAILHDAGADIEDLYRTNVVMCRPPSNRTPTEEEIACCTPRLLKELREHPATKVVALGKTANETLIPEWLLATRGMWRKVESFGKWLMPTWHPAYVLRKPSEAGDLIADLTKALREPEIPDFVIKDPNVIVISDAKTLADTLNKVPDGSWVAFDLETNNVKWYPTRTQNANSILMLQLAWSESFGIVLDDEMLYDNKAVPQILNKFFARVNLVGHNSKFDQIFLRTIGVTATAAFDTMLAHYVLHELPPHGLKELAAEEFSMPDYEARLIAQYLKNRNDEYSKIPFKALAQYGVLDVVATLRLRRVFEERLRAEDLYEWPFQKILMRAANAFVDLELRGIPVDVDYLVEAQGRYADHLTWIMEEVRKQTNHPELNLNSTQQLAVILYDELKLPIPKTRKGPPRSTSHEALEQLQGMHPVVDTMLRYRRIAKLKSSYIDNFIEAADREGFVHASILLHGTETGRLSMRDPAVQTIPRALDPSAKDYDPWMDGAVLKGAIAAPEGYVLVVCDYSQAELRCLAHYSQDPFLLEVYQHGRDLHSEVALAMFGEGYTKEQRVRCKMFNFSWVYGGNEYSFAQDQGLSINVAREFVRKYNTIMKVAVDWKSAQFRRVLDVGYVETVFGRRRRFPYISNENRDEVRKASVNAPLQSTASDLTLVSALDAMAAGVPIVHLVHDSVLALVPAELGEQAGAHIKEIMERTGKQWLPSIPWKVDVEIGRRWTEPPQF